MVILDTNIIIDHLRRPQGDTLFKKFIRENSEEELAISIVSVQELYQGESTKEKRSEEVLLAQIAALKVVSYDYKVAVMSGQISRDAASDMEFPDAIIAATAILNNAKLLTLNKKDFQGIEGLHII